MPFLLASMLLAQLQLITLVSLSMSMLQALLMKKDLPEQSYWRSITQLIAELLALAI
jgi:hypothetical protein